jgi:NAD(P)-dependent dehydrogenase (short-subunit alcohol dehydrogenase family)
MFIGWEMNLSNNRQMIVLIVGGTSGIGLESAKLLNDRGYKVVVCSRGFKQFSTTLEFLKMDVLQESDVSACFEKIREKFGRLDGLIYSTGIAAPKKSITDFDLSDWSVVFNTNLTGAILCLKYAYPLLKLAKGKVVLINSVAARIASKYSGFEYTVSKSALSGLVRQLAMDWAESGVLINSLFPSMTQTPMLEQNVAPEVLKNISSSVPLGRIATPEEVADALEFLIGPKNTYMTGCGLDINGGLFLNG